MSRNRRERGSFARYRLVPGPPLCLFAVSIVRLFLLPAVLSAQHTLPPSVTPASAADIVTSGSPGVPHAELVSVTSEPPPFVAEADLPNEPGWTLPAPPPLLKPCPAAKPGRAAAAAAAVAMSPVAAAIAEPCIQTNPYQRFLNTTTPIPLKPSQKAYLAVHNFRDPANILTIVGTAALTVGTNSHTAYGPGWQGFLSNTAYSFSQDATGEFFGTFLVPSLTHEDPHYHRVPHAPVPQRVAHAFARTLVAQHDDGSLMPNYAVLLTYPISAELANLYVPGVHGNGPSTVERIATGLATDPVNNLIAEFLPDVAKRINIRVVFVQRVVNMVTAGAATGGVSQ